MIIPRMSRRFSTAHSILMMDLAEMEARKEPGSVLKSAGDSTLESHTQTANTSTSVISVQGTIGGQHARKSMRKREERLNEWKSVIHGLRYLQGFIWGQKDAHTPSITSTLFKDPLPVVPEED